MEGGLRTNHKITEAMKHEHLTKHFPTHGENFAGPISALERTLSRIPYLLVPDTCISNMVPSLP